MAKKFDPRIPELLKEFGLDAETSLWDCHGTWVMYHKAVEQIAAKAGVQWDRPVMLETDSKAAHVAMICFGTLNEKTEWSVGECSPKNNKNAYPYAMAEKRAKDRVVLKLVGLHGLVYSEEESDDFKSNNSSSRKSSAQLKRDGAWDDFMQALGECDTLIKLEKLKKEYREKAQADGWNKSFLAALADEFEGAEKSVREFEKAQELRMAG